jgi:hypothetical protein
MEVNVTLADGTECHNSQFHRDISDKTYARAAGEKTKPLVQHFSFVEEKQLCCGSHAKNEHDWIIST